MPFKKTDIKDHTIYTIAMSCHVSHEQHSSILTQKQKPQTNPPPKIKPHKNLYCPNNTHHHPILFFCREERCGHISPSWYCRNAALLGKKIKERKKGKKKWISHKRKEEKDENVLYVILRACFSWANAAGCILAMAVLKASPCRLAHVWRFSLTEFSSDN